MMNANVKLSEQAKLVAGLAPVAPSTSTPRYISMKDYPVVSIIILVHNTTTVTGSAITVKQATNVANSGEKALSFTTMRANVDISATDTLVDTAVVSNTFTTAATNSKDLMYEITIHETDLDITNSFDCIRAGTGDSVNATVSVLYVCYPAKYGKSSPPSAILD